MKRLLLLLLSASCLFANASEKILFVGNSYLYYNNSVHNHVENLLREHYENESVDTKLTAIGGSKLQHHSIDQILNYKNFNLDKPVDKIIFQGGSSEVITAKSRENFAATAKNYSEKAQAMGIDTYLYMTHAYRDSDIRYEENLIEKIKLAYYEAGKISNSTVIPVGIAFEIAYRKNPNIKLHLPDGTHPTMLGTYLASATVFTTLTEESPEGLMYDYMGRVGTKDRIFLQKVAWEAHLTNKNNLKGRDLRNTK